MTEKQKMILVQKWYKAKADVESATIKLDTIASELMEAMDAENTKTWIHGIYSVTRVPDAETTVYDYKALDLDHPGLRNQYASKKIRKGYLKKK